MQMEVEADVGKCTNEIEGERLRVQGVGFARKSESFRSWNGEGGKKKKEEQEQEQEKE